MSIGKSDLNVTVQSGGVFNVHPHPESFTRAVEELKQSLLAKEELTTELSDAIRLLATKVTAVDDVVPDPNPSPTV